MYDSATPTALALRAYERANVTAGDRRARLEQGYGLNENDTSLDPTGSIYQGNLGSVNQEHSAEMADRARGFAGTGGLAGKNRTAAEQQAMQHQTGMLNDAFGNIADTRQEESNNKDIYEDTLTGIRANSAAATSDALTSNPISGPQDPGGGTPPNAPAAPLAPVTQYAPTNQQTPQRAYQRTGAETPGVYPAPLVAARAAAQRNQTKLTNIGFNARR